MADFIAGRAIIRTLVDPESARRAQKQVDTIIEGIQRKLQNPVGGSQGDLFDNLGVGAAKAKREIDPLTKELDILKAKLSVLRGETKQLSDSGLEKASKDFKDLAKSARELQPALEDDAKAFKRFEDFANSAEASALNFDNKLQSIASKGLNKLITDSQKLAREQERLKRKTDPLTKSYDTLQARIRGLQADYRRLTPAERASGEAADRVARELREVAQEARELRPAIEADARAFGRFSNLASQASSAADRLTGEINELSFANQINIGAARGIENQLARLGPVGDVAATGIRAAGVELAALPVAGLAAAGAITGIGLAAAALTRRGIPEVKSLQNSINVLKANGVQDLGEITDGVQDFIDTGGRAARQFSRSGLTETIAETVKAGEDASNALTLIQTSSKLAAAEQRDLASTTAGLLTNLRQYNLTVDDAARLGDQFARASNLARSEAVDLSEGFGVVGSTARAAGLDTATLLGILTELDNKGLDPAQEGARGLRTVLATLADPSAKARETFDRLGISLVDNDGKARELIDVLDDVRTAIEGDSEAVQRAAEIFETFGVNVILNLSDSYREYADEIRNADGALEDYTNTLLNENLQASQDALNASLDDLAATFTLAFAGNIAAGADALASFIRQLDGLIQRGDSIEILRTLISGSTRLGARAVTGNLFNSDFLAPAPDRSGGEGRNSDVPTLEEFEALQEGAKGLADELDFFIPPLLETGIPKPAIDTFAAAVARAKELQAALDDASTPKSLDAAQSALDAFKDATEENKRALSAVNALSQRNRSSARSAGREAKTLADVMKELGEAAEAAQLRTAVVGDSLEAEIIQTNTLLKATESAFKKALTLPDATLEDLRFLSENVEQFKAQLDALNNQSAINKVFADVAEKGAEAVKEAEALGNTEEALEDSVRKRLRLYESALGTIISLGAEQSKVDFIIGRIEDLDASLKEIQNAEAIAKVFDDISTKGAEAVNKATALGNTDEALEDSAETRLRLYESGLDALIRLNAEQAKIDFAISKIAEFKELVRSFEQVDIGIEFDLQVPDETKIPLPDFEVEVAEPVTIPLPDFEVRLEGSLEQQRGDLAQARRELETAVTQEQREAINERIELLQFEISEIERQFKNIDITVQPEVSVPDEVEIALPDFSVRIVGSIEDLEAQLGDARAEFETAVTQAQRDGIQERIELIQGEIDEIERRYEDVDITVTPEVDVAAPVTIPVPTFDLGEAPKILDDLSTNLDNAQDKFEVFGDSSAFVTESINATRAAIIALINEGFDPESDVIQNRLKDYDALIEKQKELNKVSFTDQLATRGTQSLNRLGAFGSAAGTLASTGSPQVAGANLIFDLLEGSDEFKELIELLSDAAKPIIAVLGELLGALFPVIEPLLALNAVLIPIIQLAVDILEPALRILGGALKILTDIIIGVWNALAGILRFVTFGRVDLRVGRGGGGSDGEPPEGGTFGTEQPPASTPSIALSSESSSAPTFQPLAAGTLEAAEMQLAAANIQTKAADTQLKAANIVDQALKRPSFAGVQALRAAG